MTNTLASFSMVSRDTPRSLNAVRNRPDVQREISYFSQTISSIKTVEEFVSNRRLMNFAMTSFGLKDMAYAKAFVRKILNEGHDQNSAFVNRLADKRYLDFAKTFDFNRYGAATTAFDTVKKGVVEKYVRQTLESETGLTSEGARLALYFQRQAPSLGSATEILADKALTIVAKTVLRLPDTFSLLDIDKQIAVIEDRIKVVDFKVPAKLDQFLKRFATLWDVDNSDRVQSPVLSLFGQQANSGISDALIASLSNLKTGR